MKKMEEMIKREKELMENVCKQKAIASEDVELQIESILNERDLCLEEKTSRKLLEEAKHTYVSTVVTYVFCSP